MTHHGGKHMLIKIKLPLVSVLIMAISLIIMSTTYYFYIFNILVENEKIQINQILDMESASLKTFFDSRRLEVSYLSNDALVAKTINEYLEDTRFENPDFTPNYQLLNTYFETIKGSRSEIRDVFVLTPLGRVLASSHPDSYWLDLSDREYFKSAMEGKTTISNLLVDRVDGESVLFVATPIYSGDKQSIIGVMANIIDTRSASDNIRNLLKGHLGDAYLIDQSGMIVFHTNKEMIGTRHEIDEINQFFMNSNLSIASSDEFLLNGTTYYVAYKNVEDTPWILVLEESMDKIMASAKKVLWIMLVITSTVLVVSGLVAVKLARTLTNPLTELSHVVHQTTLGDLSIRSQYLQKNELGALSNDLNTMLDELTGAYEEVESKNEELMATEEELRINYEYLSKSQRELKILQQKYISALKGSRDVVWEWDLEKHHFFASDAWHELTGLSSYNTTIVDVAFEQILNAHEQKRILKLFKEHWKSHSNLLTFTFTYSTSLNKEMYFLVKANTLWDNKGNPIKSSGIMMDITFETETNEKLHNLAFTNQLTSLPNRVAYAYDLKNLITSQECTLTVFQMDIDNFMRINDALGHNFGDILLIALANRFKHLENENITAYHLSADEFAFILYGICKEDDITNAINELYQALSTPFVIADKSIYISLSTGISVYPNDGDTVDKLIQNADTAMFAAKKTGKSNYVYYTQFLSDSVQERMDIENLLRRAVKNNLVSMHYQAQYTASNGRLNAFEALMRITDENGKSISPAVFIPVAEETGLIIELGEWAIRDVCNSIKVLYDSGYSFEHISVNVSSIQLHQPNFDVLIDEIAKETGIQSQALEIEVTESVLLSVASQDENILTKLMAKGYKISLDDFGTGYSSFSYLRTIPLTTLKIDKTFIDNLETSKKDKELVRQMIELSHELGIKVVAEGVENSAQYQILKEKSCDYIQGYYFSKALPLDQAKLLLLEESKQ